MDREKVIKGLECKLNQSCAQCPYDEDFNCIGCDVLLRDAIDLLKAQEPETAEVKWQKRHRRSYRQYKGFDSMGDEHTVTVCEELEGQEPYCGKCGAQLAESFTNFCPRCGVRLIMTPIRPTDEQMEAVKWE